MILGQLQVGLLHSPAHLASPEKVLRVWPEGSKEKDQGQACACSTVIPQSDQLGKPTLALGCSEDSTSQEFVLFYFIFFPSRTLFLELGIPHSDLEGLVMKSRGSGPAFLLMCHMLPHGGARQC